MHVWNRSQSVCTSVEQESVCTSVEQATESQSICTSVEQESVCTSVEQESIDQYVQVWNRRWRVSMYKGGTGDGESVCTREH